MQNGALKFWLILGHLG